MANSRWNGPCECGSRKPFRRCCFGGGGDPPEEALDRGYATAVVEAMTAAEALAPEAWARRRREVVIQHIRRAAERAGIEPSALAEILGEEQLGTIMAFALEDLATRRFAPGESSAVEARVVRLLESGEETIRGEIEYLEALATARPSVYRVVDVEAGRGLRLQDLVRGGRPVDAVAPEVSRRARGTGPLALAGRIVRVAGGHRLGGAVLSMPLGWAAEIVTQLDLVARNLTRDHPQAVEMVAAEARDHDALNLVLATASSVISDYWLARVLRALVEPEAGGEEHRRADESDAT